VARGIGQLETGQSTPPLTLRLQHPIKAGVDRFFFFFTDFQLFHRLACALLAISLFLLRLSPTGTSPLAMDINSIRDQVSNLTLYDLKAGVRKVQNGM